MNVALTLCPEPYALAPLLREAGIAVPVSEAQGTRLKAHGKSVMQLEFPYALRL
jgi:hypothetical protein